MLGVEGIFEPWRYVNPIAAKAGVHGGHGFRLLALAKLKLRFGVARSLA
jgi:hypothetical protein